MLSPANDNRLTVFPWTAEGPPPVAVGQTVRQFSACGPCTTLGPLVKETAGFYCHGPKFNGSKPGRISKARAHVVPCGSCRDHPRTQYPEGYMD